MEKDHQNLYRQLLREAKRVKLENDSLRKENETLLLCLELTFEAIELWAKQQGFIQSSGSEKGLEKELADRKDEVRTLFHKIIKTSEPSFLDGVLCALHLPEDIEHLVEKYLLLGGSTADDGF